MLYIILKKLRKNANLTQKQAAELTGVTKRTWERYESGASNINMRYMELFALKTNQNLSQIIKDEEDSNPDFKKYFNS